MHRHLFADRRHITQKSNDLRTRIGVLEGQIEAERTELRLLSGREREDKQFYIRNLRKTVKGLRKQLGTIMEEQPKTPTQKKAAQFLSKAKSKQVTRKMDIKMRELFRRMTPKGELVVSTLAWGSTITATLQGSNDDAPRSINSDISPINPVETAAGWFTHAIGAHPGVTVSITEAEYELIAALSDPEPKADADSLAWVRRRAFENRAREDAGSLVFLDDMRINGAHLRHLRVAVRRELAEVYTYERERLRAESAPLDSIG